MSLNQTPSLESQGDTNLKSTVHKHDAIHAVTQEHIDVFDEDDRLLDFYEWQQIIRSSETTVLRLAYSEIEEGVEQGPAVLSPAIGFTQLPRNSHS